MAGGVSVHPRLMSSFVGTRLRRCSLQQPLPQLFRYNPGSKHVSMRLSRTFSGITNLLFNRRNVDELPGKRKRLRPGNVSPYREVPKDIPRPPHVKSKTPAGLVTGPEVHDEKGI